MKPIELTAEHKDKLLEMCNHFYKNKMLNNTLVTEVVLSDQQGKVGYHAVADERVYVYIATTIGFPITIIHWFEFCINNLLSKLRLTYYNYVRSNMEEGYNHLVDYLYEKFLKLK